GVGGGWRWGGGGLGRPWVPPLVVGGGVPAVPGAEQADRVFGEVMPPAGRALLGLQVIFKRAVPRLGLRLGQVAWEHIVEGGNIGATLNAGVAAQGQDAAAGPAGVPQQGLHNGGGADHLYASRVGGPTHGVAPRPRPLPAR